MASFSLDIGKCAKGTNTKAETLLRKIVVEIFRRVSIRTPVDTGRARANWFASIGQPSNETTDNEARQSAREAESVVRRWTPVQPITLTNNLSYIETLERGRVGNKGSLQAPQGMVRITVAEFGTIVESEAQNGRNN